MKLKWDLKELTDFGKRLTDMDKFDEVCEKTTQEIAKVLLKVITTNTPVKTGVLKKAWNNSENLAYRVTKQSDGYTVELSNDTEYANWVNYGHRVRNGKQGDFGSYFKVNRRTVPYYDGNSSDYFVYGHFFVEKSIEQLTNGSHVLDDVLYKQFSKWFRWCLNG